MDSEEFINDLHQPFVAFLNKGEYHDAQRLLDKYVEDGGAKVNVAGCYIDLGSRLGDDKLILKGINAYEDYKQPCNQRSLNGKQLQIIDYNIGNGYKGLFDLVRLKKKDSYKAFVDNKYLIKAMEAYLSACSVDCADPLAELYINYANLLDTQGRYLEAIEYYDKALNQNSRNGMAYGNKAICIIQLAQISGKYQLAQYIYAYQLLEKALANKESVLELGYREALSDFQERKKEIDQLFSSNSDVLKQNTEHSPFNVSSMSEKLQGFYNFGREHDLFLQLHIQDKNCEAALVDHVFISMITPVCDEKTFYQFADWINEIKESYMIARYLLFESNRKTEDKTHISKLTVITNPLDYSTKTLYTGLKKASIKEAFNILDKIACFLNKYMGIGLEEKKVSWDRIWFREPARTTFSDCFSGASVFHERLEKLDNYTLFGLFSLCSDIEKADLRKLRNSLTHRKVSIKLEGIMESEDILDIETLDEKAVQLLKLTKYAIIYLINFVNSEENKKAKSNMSPMYIITDQFI